MDFQAFPKIARLNREMVITEKIDGTNAAVVIAYENIFNDPTVIATVKDDLGHTMNIRAQSRSRFITPGDDNFGFAAWVKENSAELGKLGPGKHFGEWWGAGIQRGYNQAVKRFSLFNVHRWNFTNTPHCCDVVPILYKGLFDQNVIDLIVNDLAENGSIVAEGFKDPEGTVVFHSASNTMFKVTCKDDEKPKGQVNVS